jgi:hypothetical protein
LLGGGIGKIPPEEIYRQIKKAIDESEESEESRTLYLPTNDELNNILLEQPKFYENTEFICSCISITRTILPS